MVRRGDASWVSLLHYGSDQLQGLPYTLLHLFSAHCRDHYHHRIIILSSSFRHCIIILVILSSLYHHCVIIINFPLLLQFLVQQNSITMTMVTLSIIMNTVTMLLMIPVMELLMMTCMEEIRRGDGGCSGASQRIFTDLKSTGYWNCVLRTATGTGYCVLVNIHVQEV